MSLREYKDFIFSIMPWKIPDMLDKEKNARSMILYTFLRLQEMFHYENLPDSIPQKYLEFYLMINGHCAIVSHEGKLYALKGGFGGEPDAYFVPTQYIIANPYLKLDKVYTRDEDCIVMGNDSSYFGLYPLVSKYCGLMSENELSMLIATINTRIISLITAQTDEEKAAADKFMEDVWSGRLSSVASSPFFDGIRTQPYATSGSTIALTSLIEHEQYLKASLLNDLGLNANYNMKRESINSNESQLNDDMLTPLIDNMLRMRQEGIEKVNEMFGTDIKVDFASAWKENEITTALEMGGLENAANDNNAPDDSIPSDISASGDTLSGEDVEDSEQLEVSSKETPAEDIEQIKEEVEEILEEVEEIKEEVTDNEEDIQETE